MRRLRIKPGQVLLLALALVLMPGSPARAGTFEYDCLVKGSKKGSFKTQGPEVSGQGGSLVINGLFLVRVENSNMESRTRLECLNNDYLTPLRVTGLIKGAQGPIFDIRLKVVEPGREAAGDDSEIPEGQVADYNIRRATICDLSLFHFFKNNRPGLDRPMNVDLIWTRKGRIIRGCLLKPTKRTNGLQTFILSDQSRVLARLEVDNQGRVIRLEWPGELTFALKQVP